MERTVCTTPLTVYVRADGNDNNDGFSVAMAKKTVASARDVLLAVDGRGYHPIIDIGEGTFESGQLSFDPWHNAVNQRIYLRGAGKGITILKNTDGNIIASFGAYLVLSDMSLQGTLYSSAGGSIHLIGNIALGPVLATARHLTAIRGGIIYVATTTCDVYVDSRGFLHTVGMGGGVEVLAAGINFVNNPTFSYGVCEAYGNCTIGWSSAYTYTGAATGRRFIADTGGVVSCGSSDPNSFLPGTIDGEIRTNAVVGGQTAAVPLTRNINTSAPLNGGGVLNADLTLGLNASSTPTANYVIQRDASGRARVSAPAAAADIARKAEVDAVDAKVADVDAKVDALDAAVIVVDGKVDAVDTKISVVDTKVDAAEAKIPMLSDAVDSSSSITAASSSAVKTAYDKAVEAEIGSVPATRNIVTSAPLSGGGTLNTDLSLGINASSTSIANYVIQRDAYGRARVGAPVSANDIARKADVDAVDMKVDAVDARVSTLDGKVGVVEAKIPALSDVVDSSSSIVAASSNAVKTAYDKAVAAGTASVPITRSIATNAPLSGGGVLSGNLTLGINASSAATANYVIQRDASGRAKVAAPSAADDIARKAEVDAVNSTLGIVNSKVDAVDAKVGAVDAKVGAVDAKVGAIDIKVGVIDGKVAAVDSRIPVLSDAVNSTSSIVAASSKAVKTAYDKAVAAETSSVPTVRTISTSAPLSGGGALSADLNLGLNASSTATANYVIQRDAGGRAQVAAPVGAADIARKAEVDAAISQIPALSDAIDSSSSIVAASSKAVKTAYDKALNSEAVSVPTTRSIGTTAPLNGGGALNSNLTLGLNASSAATPDYVILRDTNGRAQVAAPVDAADIARKADVDALSAVTTPLTRVISTTAPLTGGGDLSVNRTLAINAATTAAIGAVQLATEAEASAGTVANKAVTPTGIKAAMVAASVPLARTVSTAAPLTGGGALSANLSLGVNAATTAATGVVQLATDAEASAGTIANKAVTPTGVKTAMTAASVPLARTVSTTAPLIGGGTLSGNLTLGLNAASAATANYVVQRDASGRAKVAAPAATDDIARKAEVDAAIAKIPALSDAVSSTSSSVAASSAAVKMAYDKAVGAETLAKTQRTQCTKAWIFYVRTDGNDNNTGESDTSQGAFKTIQKALNHVAGNFELGMYSVTVNVGSGTFSGFTLPKYDSSTGRIIIHGSGKGNTILSNTNSLCINSIQGCGAYTIENLTISSTATASATGASVDSVLSSVGAFITIRNVEFLSYELVPYMMNIIRSYQGTIILEEGVTITANGYAGSSKIYALIATSGGVISIVQNLVINGVLSITALSSEIGIIRRQGVTAPVVTGTVTGMRYKAQTNSLIATNGGGENYYPGSVAGTVSTGGQYI